MYSAYCFLSAEIPYMFNNLISNIISSKKYIYIFISKNLEPNFFQQKVFGEFSCSEKMFDHDAKVGLVVFVLKMDIFENLVI